MIHPTAVIDPQAVIAPSAEIGAHVVIEGRVVIENHVTVFAGAYLGKMPKVAGIIRMTPTATPGGIVRRGSVIGANAVIYAGFDIGESVLVGDGVTLRENARIGDQSIVGNNSTLQNNVVIGKRVRIVDLSHVTAHVVIEDDVFWSVNVMSMNDNAMGPGGQLQPPYVERGARIGGGALLLPGVRVGRDAVVAAGSVVTRHVEPESRVMGVPAKTKAQRVTMQPFEDSFYEFDGWPPRPYSDWPPAE